MRIIGKSLKVEQLKLGTYEVSGKSVELSALQTQRNSTKTVGATPTFPPTTESMNFQYPTISTAVKKCGCQQLIPINSQTSFSVLFFRFLLSLPNYI
jgi:hypothetical protein